jgi:cytochrome c oxidase subunit IV
MADEKKEPLTDQATGEEVQPTPDYTPGEAERQPESATVVDAAAKEALEASEDAVDTPVVKAFDATLSAVQKGVESLDDDVTDLRRPMLEAAAAETHAEAHTAHEAFLSDTTTVFGREVTVPGGIYTVVFGFLAVATIVEVLFAELPAGILLIPILLGIAVVKGGLVVAYYMHLRTDSRLFTYILLFPLGIAFLATLFLLAVPPTGY